MENEFIEFDRNINTPVKPPPSEKPSTEKISIYEYLANRVPADAHFTINKFSHYRKARNERELESQLKSFVRNYGGNGLQELAKIHPDKQLLEMECENCKEKEKDYTNLLNNWNFQTQPNSPLYYNATGGNQPSELLVQKMNMSMIILGSFLLLGIGFLLKKNN